MDNFYARYPFASATSGVTSLNGETGAINILGATGISVSSVGQNITITATDPNGVNTIGTFDGNGAAANGLSISGTTLFAQSASVSVPGMVNLTTQSFAGNKTFTGTIGASNLSGTNTGDVTLSISNGLSLVGQALSLGLSSSTTTGALSSVDWNTFNNKGSGTVTSVAMTVPTFLSVAGSPITTSGTLAVTLSGTALPIANGGTNNTSAYTAGSVIFSNGTSLTQDNSNFFWDDTQHSLGIGVIPATNTFLDIVTSLASATQVAQLTGYGNANTMGIRMRRARGTSGTPTAVQSGDNLGFVGSRGYGTSQFAASNTSSIIMQAIENFTNTANGTSIIFNATPTGSVTLAEGFRVATAGVTLGPQSSSTAIHQVNGGLNQTTRTVTASTFTVDTTTTDYVVFTDSTSNAITITLPTPTNGRTLTFSDKTGKAGTNAITITHHASETINGQTSYIINEDYGGVTLTSDGTNWTATAIPDTGIFISTKTTSYTVVAGDISKVIRFTGSAATTFTLTSPATLGAGWYAYIENAGTGAANAGQLTFSPAAGTIDTLATMITHPGDLRLLISDGTNFTTELLQGGSVEYATAGAVTFTKPSKCRWFNVEMWGGGAGGGSGRRGPAAAARSGGGGGGAGAYVNAVLKNSDVGATVTVTVAATAAGGASITTDNTNGLVGTNGNNSTFGTIFTAYGGGGGDGGTTAASTGGGGGGNLTAGANNVGGGPSASGSTASGFGGASGGSTTGQENGNGGAAGAGCAAGGGGHPGGSSFRGGAGGGSAGGISAGDATAGGGDGGSGQGALNGGGGTGGTSSGTNGSAGTAGPSISGPGTGGGGGGSSKTTNAGSGGNGGIACGGGAGGASLNATGNSGAGGAGGSGLCRVFYG